MEIQRLHMFRFERELFCFEREARLVRGQLPFSRFFLKCTILRLSLPKRQIFMSFSS